MTLLFILGCVLTVIGIFYWLTRGDRDQTKKPPVYFVLFELALALIVVSPFTVVVAKSYVPEGYNKIGDCSYVNTNAEIITIENVYEKDGVYYQQDTSKAENWIPFHPAEYVKIENPELLRPIQQQRSSVYE